MSLFYSIFSRKYFLAEFIKVLFRDDIALFVVFRFDNSITVICRIKFAVLFVLGFDYSVVFVTVIYLIVIGYLLIAYLLENGFSVRNCRKLKIINILCPKLQTDAEITVIVIIGSCFGFCFETSPSLSTETVTLLLSSELKLNVTRYVPSSSSVGTP